MTHSILRNLRWMNGMKYTLQGYGYFAYDSRKDPVSHTSEHFNDAIC